MILNLILFLLFILVNSDDTIISTYNNLKLIFPYEQRADQTFQLVINYLNSPDYNINNAISILEDNIINYPNHSDSLQIIGALLANQNYYEKAIQYLTLSLELTDWKSPIAIANLIESYRRNNELSRAKILCDKAINLYNNSTDKYSFLSNAALVEFDLYNFNRSIELYLDYLNYKSNIIIEWERVINLFIEMSRYKEAEMIIKQGLQYNSNNYKLLFLYGVSLHLQSRLDEAIYQYLLCKQANSTYPNVNANLGAAYQGLGDVKQAYYYFNLALPYLSNDPAVLNNYGALLGIMGNSDEEVVYLLKALSINPKLEHALVNLAGYYQDEGIIDQTISYLSQAVEVSNHKSGLIIRLCIQLSPVAISWNQMLIQRQLIEKYLLLLNNYTNSISNYKPNKLDNNLDRIHFYIVYHGLNDRYIQELIVQTYQSHISNLNYISSHLTTNSNNQITISNNSNKKKIGFISKYFGIFEPHGMLLDGIMKYLPKQLYDVYILAIARTDGKPLDSNIASCATKVIDISLVHEYAMKQIEVLQLDVLIFADVLSEPINHFLAHSRFASIQIAFWGNPITSASQHIDYFISGEYLEHPYRTHIRANNDPYVEQVLLLEGQGIWYDRPISPEETIRLANLSLDSRILTANRTEFEFSDDWFIYLCSQSTFKIHPLYDEVFKDILLRASNSHIVLLGGRKALWTNIYVNRIKSKLGSELSNRLHVINRVSSERFISICQLADVILHPFPFDGSRTSADAIIAGVPYVTLPTEYLRGRMGLVFFRTMNMPELVAKSKDDYINICLKLYDNKTYYNTIRYKLLDSSDLIWEDMSIPYQWTNLLNKILDINSISWDEFINISNRNLTVETNRLNQRLINNQLFDKVYGKEFWLLDQSNEAVLESFLPNSSYQPRIFNNWRDSSLDNSIDYLHTNYSIRLLNINKWTNWLPNDEFNYVELFKKYIASSIDLPFENQLDSQLGNQLTSHVVNHIDQDNDNQINSIPETNNNSTDEIDYYLQLFYSFIKSGELEMSHTIANNYLYHILVEINSNILFTLEYGILQYYRGNMNDAYNHCIFVSKYLPDSLLTHACIGMSGTYLKYNPTRTISSLVKVFNYSHSNDIIIESKVFSISKQAIDYSLINSLHQFSQYHLCIKYAAIISNYMTNYTYFEKLLYLTMSFIDWNDSLIVRNVINNEFHLLYNQSYIKSYQLDYYDTIKSIQSSISHIINPCMECFHNNNKEINNKLYIDITTKAMQSIIYNINRIDPFYDYSKYFTQDTVSIESSNSLNEGFILITQFYISNDPLIQHNLNTVLYYNLYNKYISKIIQLNEDIYNYTFSNIPNDLKDKLVQVNISKRLSFKDAFNYIYNYYNNHTIIIANADIYFDYTLNRLFNPSTKSIFKFNNHIYSLLKWRNNNITIGLNLRTDSQDAWILQTPVNQQMIQSNDFDFHLGMVRCDNRLIELFHRYNYTVSNPALAIHAIELQSYNRSLGLYGIQNSVLGDGRNIFISDQMIFYDIN